MHKCNSGSSANDIYGAVQFGDEVNMRGYSPLCGPD